MKNLILILVGMLILTLPAFSELSDSDIKRIREIVKVEVTESEQRLRTEIKTAIDESEKQMKDYMDTKLSSFDDRVNLIAALLVTIMAPIVVAIGLPQLIIAIKQRGQEELRTELKELRSEIELLKQSGKPHLESS
jgi:ribosomal protein S20